MAFCTNCSQPVNPEFNFCPYCGIRLKDSNSTLPPVNSGIDNTPPIPVDPDSNRESIRLVIPNLLVPRSFGRSDTFNLIITEKRSIFAKLTQQIMHETIQARRARVLKEGRGFLSKLALHVMSFNNYNDHYQNLTPDQVLQETEGNYFIDNSSVREVCIKNEDDNETPSVIYTVEITTAERNLKFTVTMYDPTDDFKKAYPQAVIKSCSPR